MQYSLSTLFLIFFNVAASLALSGTCGLWNIAVILLAAFCLNQTERLKVGIVYVFILCFAGIICPGLFLSVAKKPHEYVRHAACINNLKQIGLGLHNYHDMHKHFPPVRVCDKDGKPLFSWRVEIILKSMIDRPLLDSLKLDEPWESPHNAKILRQLQNPEYKCPSVFYNDQDCSTNYLAIIGPGTLWQDKFTAPRIRDLPQGSQNTVAVVEVINSGVHWAEPRDLTVEEAIEGLKTGKGLRISTAHPSSINVLFANGEVRSLPAKMPLSLWQKLLAGEVKDVNHISALIDPAAPDMVDVSIHNYYEPGKWTVILGVIVWLLSVALLFTRAIKSRQKPKEITTSTDNAD
jgi:hypothetical protein